MQLSETIKLYMSKETLMIVKSAMDEYIRTVNGLVSDAIHGTSIAKYTTKDVNANLPAAIKNQCIRDAKSIVNKYNKELRKTERKSKRYKAKNISLLIKEPKAPILKKPCLYINNQNFKINDDRLEFPVMVDGKSRRISIKTSLTDRQKQLLGSSKLGMLRIVFKNRKIVAQVVYEVPEQAYSDDGNIMGVDLGIKCPAVSYCSDGSVKFYGNGRKNKYIRRRFAKRRKTLQKAKHMDAVDRINNKEQRIMKDIDHKISHDIIETAVSHGVNVIKMERLSNIRSTTRKSRKNNHSLHTWSFYRLAMYIEYKARLAGITVEYVNPAYTSQTCPVCGKVHHAKDRNYVCECGFHTHRDVLGSRNICYSTEYVGDSNIRRTA